MSDNEESESSSASSSMSLETSIEDTQKAIDLFLNNKYDEAKQIVIPWIDQSIYHALGNSYFLFIEGLLTFEEPLLILAAEACKQCVMLCNKFRKKNTVGEALEKMIKKTNYDSYTPLEIHAELCYAESLLIKSMLAFLEDETFASFLKGGLQVKNCFNCYKECQNILVHRQWTPQCFKSHFESGVKLGLGSFNIMISMLPPRVAKLLEFIGFSGNREIGLSELTTGYKISGSVRTIPCGLSLLSYHLVMETSFCHDESNLELCEEILTDALKTYPKGMIFLYFKGRLEILEGNVDGAIHWFSESWKTQDHYKGLHDLCFWELYWCYSMKCQWREALTYVDLLLKQSKWSLTTFAYHKAATVIMLGDQATSNERIQIEDLMRSAPQWKQRIAGKSIPIEKFIVKKTVRYFEQNNTLVLPVIELMYMWNIFKLLGKDTQLIQNVYSLCEEALLKINMKPTSEKFHTDNKALVIFLQGACLHQMKSRMAEQCLNDVISMESKIKDDLYIIPFSIVELAHVYLDQGKTSLALPLLHKAKKKYSGYSMESRLHFTIHSLEHAEEYESDSSPSSGELLLDYICTTLKTGFYLHGNDMKPIE
ncbi:Tetratricopeptide repeat protein 39B [Blattella germanica]|nr:Tetratricopeptide repeat protein 39B [Blattella germanica]